jgi:hypothetical protein
MFFFVLGIIVVLIGLGFVFIAPATTREAKQIKATRIIGAVLVVIAFLFYAAGGIKSVPVKSIGVATSFGAVDGAPLTSGPHETWAPWKSVNVVDETIQTTTFEGCQGQFCEKGDEVGQTAPPAGDSGSSTAPCLEVRIGGQQEGCLDVTIQWQIRSSAADSLFLDYANQGPLMPEIENAVVIRELRQVANTVLGDYNPIEDVSLNSGASNSKFTTFQPKVLEQMNADIGSRVKIVSILMPLLRYDSTTQSKLDEIQQQYAATAIASQTAVTNSKQAAANRAIAASVSNDPAVLQYLCYQIIQDAIKSGYTGLPATLNCSGENAAIAVGDGK